MQAAAESGSTSDSFWRTERAVRQYRTGLPLRSSESEVRTQVADAAPRMKVCFFECLEPYAESFK